MAILIGVIALAVIPNIQRSRESKDLTTLDNVLASTNIAIANNKMSGSGGFKIDGATYTQKTASDANEKKVMDAVKAELGSITLGSSSATKDSAVIYVFWGTSGTAAAQITVLAGTDYSDDKANQCEYTTEHDHFIVKSGASS